MNPYTPAPDLLKNRTILVTGAGQGLGRAAAIAYARHGATVILLGRSVRKLEQVYDEILAIGGPQPAIFPMDLAASGDAHFDAMAEAIGYQFGRLDGILHCAAAFESLAPQALESVEDWMKLFKVNAAAPAAINRVCADYLAASGVGDKSAGVILVGESHGHQPVAYWGGFAVSKAALEAYFRVQADEWADSPMRINLIIPGPINSPQRAKTHPGEAKDNLPQPDDLLPRLLYLMGPDSADVRGRIFEGCD
ncbi:MAG: NAD(P)-dependent oxidoreductase [Hydrogenophilales bacterium 28-61-23]|nr:MAG: NAD(P)-dependent oxidoreductase [Hydrogenophilales bacterium 28-61-23]